MPPEVSALETGHSKLWILLVGVNEYYDRRLPSLQYSEADCQGVAQALTHATQKFSARTIWVHHDTAEFPPTVGAVRKSLGDIVEHAQPEDTVLFYFCGHSGLEPRFQQAVLCLADTEKEGLLKTGLSLMSLLGQLGNCAAKHQILWLDLFHGNGMTLQDGLEGQLPFDNPAWQLSEMLRQHTIEHAGFSAFLSCDAAQRTRGAQPQQSWKFPELGQSVFAHCLVEGLRGAAANAQGVIDAHGLEEYVSAQTQQFISQANDELRRLHEPSSNREGLLLSPKYLVQTPKRIGQSQTSCVLGLKLPDLLESIVPPVQPQEAIETVAPIPLELEPEQSADLETVELKTETPAIAEIPLLEERTSEVSSEELEVTTPEPETTELKAQPDSLPYTEETLNPTFVEIPEAPVSEFTSDLVVEPITEEDLEQIEVDTDSVTEFPTEPTEPASELVFEPVIGSVTESEPLTEPVSGFVSDLIVEPVADDDLDLSEVYTESILESSTETIEPVTELIFDPVIGSVVDRVEISEEPVSELVSDLIVEPITDHDLDQIEVDTEDTISELIFDPIIGTVAEPVEIAEEPAPEFVSDFTIEPLLDDDLDQDLDQIEVDTEDTVSELIFEPVIGAITDEVELEEPAPEFVSDFTIEPITEDDFDQIEVDTEDTVSELIFEPVIGAIAEPVEIEEPAPEFVSDFTIEPITEDDLDQDEISLESVSEVEPISELAFEPTIGAVTEPDLDQVELPTTLASDSLIELAEPEVEPEPVEIASTELISEEEGIDEESEEEGIDEEDDTIEDDLGSFVNSVHKAVGKSTSNSISESIASDVDSELSSPIPEISIASQNGQLPRSNRRTRQNTTRAQQPTDSLQTSLRNRFNETLATLQRSSRDAASTGQEIYQHHAPTVQNTITTAITQFGQATHQFTQTTLDSLRHPRTQKIAIVTLGSVGFAALGWTGFSLYQQRNTQLNAIQSLSSNATTLLSTNRTTEALVDALKAGEQLQQTDRPWNFIPDPVKLTTIATLQQAIAQSNAASTALLDKEVRNVTMSSDAKTFAVVTPDQAIQLWQRDGNQLNRLKATFNVSEGHQAPITQIRFSPDGKILASASEDKTIKLWDIEKETLIKTLTGHTDRITAIRFRPDGGVLASASRDRTIKLWGVPSGNLLDTMKGHDTEITVMTFSPDGRVFSAGSTTNTIYLWFPDSNKPLVLGRHPSTNSTAPSQGITDLAFSPDGKTIASASWNDAIKLWTVSDAKSGQEASPRQSLNRSTRATSLSFSPDAKWLASGEQDGTINLWDLQTATVIKTLAGHQGSVQQATFNADGKGMTSVSDRTGLLLWNFDLSTLIKQGCTLIQPELRTNPLLQTTNLCRSD